MKKIILFSFLFVFLFACKKKADTNTPEMKELPADFRAFYENFHADSLYQFRHISFPLSGLPPNADSTTIVKDNFAYQANDWRMHHVVDFSTGEFLHRMTFITDKIITEHIIKADNSFGIERRFGKLSDGEWYLIYYVAPNHYSKVQ